MARRNATTESTDAAPANETPADESPLPTDLSLPGPLVPLEEKPPLDAVAPPPLSTSVPPLSTLVRWEVRLTPHNPGTRIVEAVNEVDAVKEYFRVMGIVRSDNMPKVTLVTDETAAETQPGA